MFNTVRNDTDLRMIHKYQQSYDEVRNWFDSVRVNKNQFDPWDEMMEYISEARTPSQAAILMTGVKLGVRLALTVLALRENKES